MNVLCVFAHLDDESYGPAATIKQLADLGNNVSLLVLCKGRPNGGMVNNHRHATFLENCHALGVDCILPPDAMGDLCLDYRWTLDTISSNIDYLKPDFVITHNNSDLHQDHKIVAEAALVACRPKPECTVKTLMFCENPQTMWSVTTPFVPNVFVPITSSDLAIKQQCLQRYTSETYDPPDLRSVDGVTQLAKMRGMQSGYEFAEAFQLVFARGQIPL